MSDARRVLITGATGFVGGYLIAHLRAAHPAWQVIGTTRRGAEPDAGFVCCDLRDAALTTSPAGPARGEELDPLPYRAAFGDAMNDDLKTWQALGTMNGGEVGGDF